jgi:hypothetical protein
MIKRFLNFFRRSARPSQAVPESHLALTRTRVGDTSLVRINVDDWEPDTQQALHALAAKHANLTFYDGKVQHGYALSHVATWTQCPRCHANTQQHYTNVIYATQTALRVLFAPAGYFCTRCPTAIIDEAMVRAGITASFTLRSIVGIAYETRETPDYFLTWNGRDVVYILDEAQMILGIETLPPEPQHRLPRHKHKSQARKRLARESRRRNRPQR